MQIDPGGHERIKTSEVYIDFLRTNDTRVHSRRCSYNDTTPARTTRRQTRIAVESF